jgi:hypothetical protein
MSPSPIETIASARARGLARGKTEIQRGGPRRLRDLARGLARDLKWPLEDLERRVVAFHAERLERLPDLGRYPELRGARELREAEYAGMVEAGMTPAQVAFSETLAFWRDTVLVQETGRAWRSIPRPEVEKCRILYLPETEVGAVRAKNVDDLLSYHQPAPPIPPGTPWPFEHPLCFDGVGSGLHLDEMPPEVFPARPLVMCPFHCRTVPEAKEFLVRYNFFWCSQNLMVHDQRGNSVIFEKTRCRVATRGPDSRGRSFISGMGALDPELHAFQQAQREKYLGQNRWGPDHPDACFWRMCRRKWERMRDYVAALGDRPSLAEINALMERRDPDGPLCLTGVKCHPDEVEPGRTLEMRLWLLDRKQLHRRQWRGDTPAYLDPPEIVQFASPSADPAVAAALA